MKVGIIGGGIMGLTLAYRLSEAGHSVSIIEAAPQVGGLSTWYDFGDFVWDKYYHVILQSDSYLLGLIEELGLTDQLVWTPTKTGFLWMGEHHSMSNYLEFIRFPVLTLFQKGRLASGILYSRYLRDPSLLECISAKEWLKIVFGSAVYEKIWEPLLESKFGTLKNKIPATIIWSTINRYHSTRNKRDGKEWMGHLRGTGLKVLLDELVNRITENNGQVHTGMKIASVDDKRRVKFDSNHEPMEFDSIISTVPTRVLNQIAPNLQEHFHQPYVPQFLGVIRLALVLKESLSPFYVTNLIDRGNPFTGIIEVSQLAEPEEMAGQKLVMLPRYDLPDSEWFDYSDDKIEEIFLAPLYKTFPKLKENIISTHVHRERIVQALWIERPPERFDPAHTPDGTIWSINAELAGRDTLNNNAIVRVANEAGQKFLEKIAQVVSV